eukprot:scaffold165846_cov42-Prasinocladus_malaysianus.AAC.1
MADYITATGFAKPVDLNIESLGAASTPAAASTAPAPPPGCAFLRGSCNRLRQQLRRDCIQHRSEWHWLPRQDRPCPTSFAQLGPPLNTCWLPGAMLASLGLAGPSAGPSGQGVQAEAYDPWQG